jgi:hypothetical protein
MTRRIPKPQLGGVILLQCRYGHTPARVASGTAGDIQPLESDGWKHPVWEVLDKPLALRCRRCEAEGKRPDLRGSWEKVRALSDRLEADMATRSATYVLGG